MNESTIGFSTVAKPTATRQQNESEPRKRQLSADTDGASSSVASRERKRSRLDTLLEQEDVSPVQFALSLARENGFEPEQKCSFDCNRFRQPSEEQIAAYDLEVVNAVKEQDIDTLRNMVASGRTLQCSNCFGESLLHMACRRGFTNVVRYMVEEADVSVYIRDDYGRVPMHDACWSPEPNFELVEVLIRQAPEQVFLSDVRGHTPFAYVRKNHWEEWKRFLSERRHLIRSKTNT